MHRRLRCIPITRLRPCRVFAYRRHQARPGGWRQAQPPPACHPGRWRCRRRDRRRCRGGGRQVRVHPALPAAGPGSTALDPAPAGRAPRIRQGTCPGRGRTSTPATSTTPATCTTPASSPRPSQASLSGPTGPCGPIDRVRPTARPGPAGRAGSARQQVPLMGPPDPTDSRRRAELRDPTERRARTGPRGQTGPRQETGPRRTTAPARASARPGAAAQTPAMPQLRTTAPARPSALRPTRTTVKQTAAAGTRAPPGEAMSLPRARATAVARADRPGHSSRQARPRPAEIQARATRSPPARRPTGDCMPCPTPPLQALGA